LPRWNCLIGNLTKPSFCSPICGDGFKVGNETCDAGSKPGCLDDCTSNAIGWKCSGGVPDICNEICGDGLLVGEETCDSGPINECSTDCKSILFDFNCTGGDDLQPSNC